MKRPAVFLDRDGTLIEDVGFIRDVTQVEFYPRTISALRRLDDFVLFIVTNQSGIALGHTREDEVRAANDHIVRRLAEEGIRIREVYCCPHQRSDGCECIKPNPHFLKLAESDYEIDLARSFVVGDHPSDVEFAHSVGARGIYVLTGHGAKHRAELCAAETVVAGIAEAAEAISLAHAAEILRAGGIVAIPTETVYGLGADASNESAVRRVFTVKGRPETHPLIVHLADAAMMSDWAVDVPDAAMRLAERFWPGPLTLIVPKAPRVPGIVTGGQESVGLRVPSHPLALALLREFRGGIAAPSANRFGFVSPTSAEHVRRDLGSDVDFILDGGLCEVGLESTIVNLTSDTPTILRPGGVTQKEIESTLGCNVPVARTSNVRASGQLKTHYAPRATVVLAPLGELEQRAEELRKQGHQVRVLSANDVVPQQLFASLRRADDEGAEFILAAPPDERGLGVAVGDRLLKAAAPRTASD